MPRETAREAVRSLGESWSRNFRRTNSRPSHVRGSASTGGGTGGPQLPAARRPRGRRQGSAGQAVRHRQRHGCGSLRRHRSTGSNRSNRSTGSSRQTRSTALIRQTRSRPPSRPTGRSKTTAPTRPTRRTVRTPRNATTERTPPSETTGIRPLPQPTDRVTAGSTRSGFRARGPRLPEADLPTPNWMGSTPDTPFSNRALRDGPAHSVTPAQPAVQATMAACQVSTQAATKSDSPTSPGGAP